jgi:hypothetical protein
METRAKMQQVVLSAVTPTEIDHALLYEFWTSIGQYGLDSETSQELIDYLNVFLCVDKLRTVPLYGERIGHRFIWRKREHLLEAHAPIEKLIEIWLKSARRRTIAEV